jgi:hypothetical protein
LFLGLKICSSNLPLRGLPQRLKPRCMGSDTARLKPCPSPSRSSDDSNESLDNFCQRSPQYLIISYGELF